MIVRQPFVYMRHGQTGYNAHDWFCGSHDIPLNDIGEEQAREAAPLLNRAWSVVLTSGLQRAQQTARLAVPQADLLVDTRFNERHFGDHEGQPIQRPIDHLVTPPNGEAWSDFRQRVAAGLNAVLEQHSLPLIVAHGAVFRCMYDIFYNTTECESFPNATPVLVEPVGEVSDDSHWRITPLADLSMEQRAVVFS